MTPQRTTWLDRQTASSDGHTISISPSTPTRHDVGSHDRNLRPPMVFIAGRSPMRLQWGISMIQFIVVQRSKPARPADIVWPALRSSVC